MRQPLSTILFVGLFLSVCGCDLPKENATGRVAVIDLDRIAGALGRDDLMTQRLQEAVQQRQQNVAMIRDTLRAQLEEETARLGRNPTEEQKARLNQLTAAADTRMREVLARADQEGNQLRTRLILEFREEMEPVARRVAAERGLSIVMVKQDHMLYVDPEVDITDVVIDEIQAAPRAGNASGEASDSK